MAKRKKSRKTSRRRRVGAMSFNANSPLVKFGSIAVGFLASDKINAMIDKVTGGKLDPKLVALLQAGGGAYYSFMHKGKKNLPLAVVSGVLTGAGAKRAMSSFGIGKLLAGYGDVPVIGKRVAGYQEVPVIGNGGYVTGYDTAKVPVMAGVSAGDSGSGITNSGGGGYMS